ncbi:hypothetical protein AKO1_002592 [Acrasis kona]|uniref:Glutamine amidotransferase domain-containing protein n=1 Tax=Acrasis kona TaxID=1008807 RepID=A0AAW2ZMZ0_9EUKA
MASMKKIAIFDPTDRIESQKGLLIKEMFERIQGVETEIFAIKYNHFPVKDNDLTLDLIDSDLEANGENSTIGQGHLPTVESIFEYLTKEFDGLVIGGNNDHEVDDDEQEYFKVYYPLINKLLSIDYPLLGICWGAQSLMRAIEGDKRLTKMTMVGKEPQIGILKFSIIKENPLFDEIANEFFSTSYHMVCFILDKSAKIICSRDGYWDNQAFQYKNKRCFGLQFHPEHTLKSSNKLFEKFKNMSDEEKREFVNAKLIFDNESPDEDVGTKIATNFIRIAGNSSFESIPTLI